jgi:hypothetical protein
LVATVFLLETLSWGTSFSFTSSQPYPPYATEGAYAYYSGDGGFIAFLSGVSGNITYTVTNVFSNDTMNVWLNGNLSLGTELTINVSTVSENFTDSVFAPKVLPAVPPSNLTAKSIVFQNFTCQFVAYEEETVPAGTFNTTEYQATDPNGTTLDFWFDRSSGLAVQMVEPGSYFQLITSNIAIPLSTQSAIASELPFILVFVAGWAGAGALFFWVRRYYIKKSERADVGKLDGKSEPNGRKKSPIRTKNKN